MPLSWTSINGLFLSLALLSAILALVWQYKRVNQFSLWIIILAGFTLRIIPAQDAFLHEWDERFHALVAKNMGKNLLAPSLYQHPVLDYNYQNWTANHIWLHKQPLALWIIHVSLQCFGLNTLAVRLPSVILSVCCIWFTFLICKLLFKDQKTAVLAAFLQAINGFLIENAVGRIPTDHVDAQFLFFTELSVLLICLYAKQAKFWLLMGIGIALGLSILTKWLTGLFVLPLFGLLLWRSQALGKLVFSGALIGMVATLLALPWQLYILKHFPQEALWEYNYNSRHLFEAIEGHDGEWYYHLLKARMIWNELVYLPFLWLLYAAWRSKNRAHYFLLAWILIPYLFFSMVPTKMTGYIIICAPAVFIAMALFIQKIVSYSPNWGKVLAVLMLGLSIRYCIERIKPFEVDPTQQDKLELVQKIDAYAPNAHSVVFNFPHPIEAMFYTACTAYSTLPTVDELLVLQEKGYRVLVFETGDLKEVYRRDEIGLFK